MHSQDGIFFDQGPTTIQGVDGQAVNPSDTIVALYKRICDYAARADILVFEEEADVYIGTATKQLPPLDKWVPWFKNNPPRIHHTVHGCGSAADIDDAIQKMQRASDLAIQRGAGYVYIIDSRSDDYARLPIYWDAEVSTVAAPYYLLLCQS
jgi:hypothetical protein